MSSRGPRARGHAAFAAQARRALGVSPMQAIADVPLPLVHAALGLAACAVAFLARVPALGFRTGVIASAAVAAGTGCVLILYDRLVYQGEHRPGLDSAVLPVAAVGSFSVVLAAAPALWLRIVAALFAAVLIGGVPYLGERELAGRHNARLHLIRDLGGVAIAVPFALAGQTPSIATWSRALIAGAGLGMVAFDGLRVEAVRRRLAARGAAVCGAAVMVAAVVGNSGGPGVRAALILLVWYGVRGAAASYAAGRRGVVMILEYLAFAIVALLALAWVGAGR